MTDEYIKKLIQTESDLKYSGSLRFFKPANTKRLVGSENYDRIKSAVSKDLHNPHSLMIYCFMNDIFETPKCKCGNDQKFNTTKKEFSKYCSNKCRFTYFEESVSVRKETCLKKYGATNFLASKEGMEKILSSNMERYGVSNYTKTEEYKTKYSNRPASEEKKKKIREAIRFRHYSKLSTLYPEFMPLFSSEEYVGVKGYKQYPWFCKTCNKNFMSSMDNGFSPVCNHCKPTGSDLEVFTKQFLDDNGIDYIFRYRGIPSGRELDIFIPTMNIGIELHGLYWHSTSGPSYSKNDHITKLEECESVGIRLVSIFSDEIKNSPRIVKSRLKSVLGLNGGRIMARKCEVKELTSTSCHKFLSKYHIQGAINSSIRYGLYYRNRLVAAMTFNKGRPATGQTEVEGVYELSRYCTISRFIIIGGAGKLLSHFIKNHNPIKIYSYADRRWSRGELYEKLGFKFVRNTAPNYWYTKDFKSRLHRMNFQKSKLKNFPSFSEDKKEYEIMEEEKFFRTWDCGSKYYELHSNNDDEQKNLKI